MVKKFKVEWRKGYATRYYVLGTGISVQIGKYRKRDKFERDLKIKPTWQGKWYVEAINHSSAKLFNTEKQARTYLKKLIEKLSKRRKR